MGENRLRATVNKTRLPGATRNSFQRSYVKVAQLDAFWSDFEHGIGGVYRSGLLGLGTWFVCRTEIWRRMRGTDLEKLV